MKKLKLILLPMIAIAVIFSLTSCLLIPGKAINAYRHSCNPCNQPGTPLDQLISEGIIKIFEG